MKILLIEDNEHKRKKINDFINNLNLDINIDLACSYTTGLNKAKTETYDLLILDMSMPTFDKTPNESGGRFRTFGGKEIIRQLKRKRKEVAFCIVSSYPKFSEDNNQTFSLEDIGKMLEEVSPEYYIGTIFYNTREIKWREDLEKIIINIGSVG